MENYKWQDKRKKKNENKRTEKHILYKYLQNKKKKEEKRDGIIYSFSQTFLIYTCIVWKTENELFDGWCLSENLIWYKWLIVPNMYY